MLPEQPPATIGGFPEYRYFSHARFATMELTTENLNCLTEALVLSRCVFQSGTTVGTTVTERDVQRLILCCAADKLSPSVTTPTHEFTA